RRRDARRQSPWQRAVHTARQGSVRVRHTATGLAGTVMATPRAQGAAAAASVLIVFRWLRRRRARRHAGVG
ncbi:hypothetical protein, partial [Nonomuraea lactucae]|uniref:hypothetical protein n=1 Tax=Nonomuraea lactucae TaxID=2249762 RepID=UPI0013B3AD8F